MNRLFIQNSILRIIVIVLIISLVSPSILYAAPAGGSSSSPLYKALKAFQDAKEQEKKANANLKSAIENAREARNRLRAAAEKTSKTPEYLNEKIRKIASQIGAKRDELATIKIWPEVLRERKQEFDKIYNDFKDGKPPFKEGEVRENAAIDRRLRQEFNKIEAEIEKWGKDLDEKKKILEKEIELLEYKKISLENAPPEYAKVDKTTEEKLNIEWTKAALDVSARDKEVRKAEKAVSDAFEKYLEEMGKLPPPFLKSVSVYDGSWTYYKKQYTSADLHVQAKKIQEVMVKLDKSIIEAENDRKELSDKRVELTEELKPKIKRLNRLANRYGDEMWNREALLVIAEVALTMTEIALTGGTATLARKGGEVAAELATEAAGKTFTVKGVKKLGRVREVWNKHRRALGNGVERADDWVEGAGESRGEIVAYKFLSKHGTGWLFPLPKNKTAEILVAESIEWGIESGGKIIHDVSVDWWKKQGVRRNLRKNIVNGVKNRGTVFSVVTVAVKLGISSAYDVETYNELFWKLYAEIAVTEKMRYELVKADKQISNEQKELRRLFALLKARLDKLNRTLKPESIKDDAVTDKKAILTLSLEFSTNLTSPPIVKVAGLEIPMKPEGARDNSKVWKGTIDVEKLDKDKNTAPLVVSLKKNSRPYDALDSDPKTPAYAMLTRYKTWDELLNEKHWRGYEKGADTNHEIKFDFNENAFILRVITKTASSPPEAKMDANLQAYVAINRDLANKQELNTDEKNEFELGQIDTFHLKFEYPIKDVKFILLDVEDTDEWLCESIVFQFIKGGKKSRVYKYDENIWFSDELEDKTNPAYRAVKAKEYKVNPYDDGLR